MWLTMVALNAAFAAAGLAADAARVVVPLSTTEVKTGETTGGDLVADAILEAAKRATDGETKPAVALINAAQFQSGTVGPGKVTAAQICGLLSNPDRKWTVSEISGTSLELAMERSLSRVPEPSANVLQVAGIGVKYDENAPAGHRVALEDLEVDGRPVQASTKYRVAMPEDLAMGGAGYFTIPDFNESSIIVRPDSTLADAINEFMPRVAERDYAKLDRVVKVKP